MLRRGAAIIVFMIVIWLTGVIIAYWPGDIQSKCVEPDCRKAQATRVIPWSR